jgi:hypothetical protein
MGGPTVYPGKDLIRCSLYIMCAFFIIPCLALPWVPSDKVDEANVDSSSFVESPSR